MTHPYEYFEGSELWNAVEAALDRLEENDDFEPRTSRKLIVGYLVRALVDAGLVAPEKALKKM
jgi:hypothetical protein